MNSYHFKKGKEIKMFFTLWNFVKFLGIIILILLLIFIIFTLINSIISSIYNFIIERKTQKIASKELMNFSIEEAKKEIRKQIKESISNQRK